MAEPKVLLQELLDAGLIDIGENDEAFKGLVEAAHGLSATFVSNPSLAIAATLVAIDATAPASEPAFQLAKEEVIKRWPTFANRFRDEPRTVLRMVLFTGLRTAATSRPNIGGIVSLTSVTPFEFLDLGREREVFKREFSEMMSEAEEEAARKFALVDAPAVREARPLQSPEVKPPEVTLSSDYVAEIRSAAGAGVNGGNPYWPSSNAPWANEFASRMAVVIQKGLAVTAEEATTASAAAVDSVVVQLNKHFSGMQQALGRTKQWVHRAYAVRLNALWWAEALYSPTTRRTYREFGPEAASFMMAADLHDVAGAPTPSSVAYFLGETVRRMLGPKAQKKVTLENILVGIRRSRDELKPFVRAVAGSGRLPLGDVANLAIQSDAQIEGLIKERTGFAPTAETTPARFAMACFRDLQAGSISSTKP